MRPLPEVLDPLHVDIAQTTPAIELGAVDVQPQVHNRYDPSGRMPNPLRHFVAQQSGLSASEKAHMACDAVISYAANRDFLDFAQTAKFTFVLRREVEAAFAKAGGVVDGKPFVFLGQTYISDPHCADMLVGYPKDLYVGELAEQAGPNPYKFYDLYIQIAKTYPPRLVKLANNDYRKKLVALVRKQLGAEQATIEGAKDMPDDRIDKFRRDAGELFTKQQVDYIAEEYHHHYTGSRPRPLYSGFDK